FSHCSKRSSDWSAIWPPVEVGIKQSTCFLGPLARPCILSIINSRRCRSASAKGERTADWILEARSLRRLIDRRLISAPTKQTQPSRGVRSAPNRRQLGSAMGKAAIPAAVSRREFHCLIPPHLKKGL